MEQHIIIQQNHVLATIINLAGNLSLMDHIRLGVLNGFRCHLDEKIGLRLQIPNLKFHSAVKLTKQSETLITLS